jgi:hypothetical protein
MTTVKTGVCRFCGWTPEDGGCDYAQNEIVFSDEQRTACSKKSCLIAYGATRKRIKRSRAVQLKQLVQPVRDRFQQDLVNRRIEREAIRKKYLKTKGKSAWR